MEERTGEDRRVDHDTRERIVKLDTLSQGIHEDLQKMNKHFEKMSDSYTNHVDHNNASFSEVRQTLTEVSMALRQSKDSIADLKETSKNLMDTQNKLLTQFSIIENSNKQIELVQADCRHLKEEITQLKQMEAQMKASWKTLTIAASVIAFAISTAISVGAFQLGMTSTTGPNKTSTITEYIVRPIEKV